jgi:hypothetical protein
MKPLEHLAAAFAARAVCAAHADLTIGVSLPLTGPLFKTVGFDTPQDHWGFANDSAVVMKVVDGDWKVER